MTYNAQQRKELKAILTEMYAANPPMFQKDIAKQLTDLGWKSPAGHKLSQSSISVWARKLNVGRRLKHFKKGANRKKYARSVLPTIEQPRPKVQYSSESDRAALIEILMQTNMPAKNKLECVKALVNS